MKLKIKILAFVLLTGLTAGLLPAGVSLASTDVIYISPGSLSAEKGHDFTVALEIQAGSSVNAAQATVGYSTSSLKFLSLSLGAFNLCAQDSGGGGSVVLSCARTSSSSGTFLIADITFEALAGSGSTSLSIGNAGAADAGTNQSVSTSGSTVRFTSPASSSGGSSTSSSSGSNGGASVSSSTSSSSVQTTTKPKPAPKLTMSAGAVNAELTTATATATTNISATVFAKYGTSQTSLTQTSSKSGGTNHSVTFSSLTPGTNYYYQLIAQGSAGQTTKGSVESFTTKGFTVSVTVLGSQNQPLVNQQVTLHSTPMTATTNSKGVATFYNVAPGLHHLDYTYKNQNLSQAVYVSNDVSSSGSGQSAPTQTAAVIFSGYSQKLAPASSNHSATVWIIIGAVLLYIATWVVLLRKTLRHKLSLMLRSMRQNKFTT